MAFTPLKTGSNFSATGGSVFFDDKFHTLQYGLMFGVPFCSYYAYDVKTWELAEYKDVEDFSMMSISSAYDPTTGDVYGCFYSEKLDGTMTFGTVNYTTLTREVICDLDKAVCAMAINNRGELYGISEDGMLFSIDKTNGKMTNIGNTGVPVSLYLQSAAFDYKTDKMYWAQISDETGCALYEVNVKTGKAEKISDFPENEEFSCISIPFITPEAVLAR